MGPTLHPTETQRTCNDDIHLRNRACLPHCGLPGAALRVRLTRRLAECVDGIDLSERRVGDVLDLSPHDGELLIAEGWATAVASPRKCASDRHPRAAADDRSRSRKQRRPS